MSARRTLLQVYDAVLIGQRQTQRDLGIVLAFLIVFPVGFLFFLGLIVKPSLLPQVLVGSLMMEMALLNINALAQNIGQEKQLKIYDLWVSLPISPVVYVLSQAIALLIPTMVSAAVTIAIGVLFFHIHVSVAILPLLFLAFLLVWTSTIGVGFLIGVYGRSPRQINTLAQFVGIVMTFFAPIFYPISALPGFLQVVAYGWPLTWGAILFAALLHGPAGSAALATLVLLAFSAIWFVLIGVGLRWRQV